MAAAGRLLELGELTGHGHRAGKGLTAGGYARLGRAGLRHGRFAGRCEDPARKREVDRCLVVWSLRARLSCLGCGDVVADIELDGTFGIDHYEVRARPLLDLQAAGHR